MRPREGVNRPLWCEFTGLLYCSQTFRLADEEDWIQHHLDHLGNNAPETSMCWFCDDHIFAADRPIDTNARFAKFRQRMRHIRDHIIHNPRLTENVMRPDFHLINEIHSRGLLSENMYQHAKAYDELPDAYKLPGSTSSPPSSSWQPRDKPQFVLESRRSRRRRSRERRKGTAKKVEGEADAA
ncbi:hypothetical protein QBC44DRAFT_302229 [Cladorrhinum sp. PSN332]|nr:hypothetical protein QBC44DRAFT_302229 [Cladorrhinum sp. PSN332]